MSKDYVEELMNILDRDADNGKFDDDESEFIIADEDYDDNYDDDDDCDSVFLVGEKSNTISSTVALLSSVLMGLFVGMFVVLLLVKLFV